MFSNPTNINNQNIQNEFLLDGNADNNYGNNGTSTNIIWGATSRGYLKKRAYFDGTGYITTGINWIPSGVQSYYSFWVNPTDLSEGDTFSSTNPRNILGMDTADTAFIRFLGDKINVGVNDGSWHEYHSAIGSLVENKEQFVEIIITPSSTVKCYIDGVLQGNDGTNDVFPATWNNGNHTIGRNTYSTQRYYKGCLGLLRSDTGITTHQRDRYLEGLKKFGPSILQQYPELFEGCVGLWDMRGDASNLIDGVKSTVNGAILTTDHLGNSNSAYSFDRTSVIDSNSSFDWNTKNQGSWTFIVKTSSTTDDYFIDYDVSNSSNDRLNVGRKLSGGEVRIYTRGASGENWYIDSDITINDGNYHIITTQVDQINSALNIYIDGVLHNGTLTGSGASNIDVLNNIKIGSIIGGSSDGLNGDISLLIIHNNIISASEVSELHTLLNKKYIYPFAKYTPASLPKPLFYLDGTNDGTTWYDQSGNGRHFTQSGGVTSGRVGQSKYSTFDGTDDKLVLSAFNPNTEKATILTKFKSDITQNDGDYNLLYRWSDGSSEGDIAIYYSGYGANNTRAWARQSDGTDAFVINFSKAIPITKYSTFAQVIDNANDIMKLYFNGVLVGTHSTTLNAQMNISNDFVIGGRNWAGEEDFDGNIEEVIFYDEILSDKQIEERNYANYF